MTDIASLVRNNIYVYGIRGEGRSATHRAMALMAAKRFDATLIHTHTFPLADLPTALHYAPKSYRRRDQGCGARGVRRRTSLFKLSLKEIHPWLTHPRVHIGPPICSGNSTRASIVEWSASVLVSETDRVRVWHLHIAPGKRCGFHRHVLNYFWTAHNAGHARGYFEDGRIVDSVHYAGETKHLDYGAGEHMVHSVENIGTTPLLFTTVEFLDSPNQALPIPDEARLKKAA